MLRAVLCLLLCVFAAAGAELPEIASVYLLPMSGGLDQHLASQLTRQGVWRVVTEPLKADAVITDRLGEAFEKWMADQEREAAGEPEEQEQTQTRPPVRPFVSGAAKGTIFVVHPRTREVVWSSYERPRGVNAERLEQAAERHVTRLKKALGK